MLNPYNCHMSQLHQGQWITFKRQQRFKNFKIMALKDYMTGHHYITLRSQSNLIYFAHFLIDVIVIEPSLAVRLTLREYGEQRKERRLSSQLWMLWRLLGRTCNYRIMIIENCEKMFVLWIAKLIRAGLGNLTISLIFTSKYYSQPILLVLTNLSITMAANFQSDSISFSSSMDFSRPVMNRISW